MEDTFPRPTAPRAPETPHTVPARGYGDAAGLNLRAPDPDDDCVIWMPIGRSAAGVQWASR